MRINKFISESGICSRREADAWIAAGRVAINGVVATLGSKVDANDRVTVDGEPVGQRNPPVYIALHKPTGITCTTERSVAGNIVDYVEHPQRIFPIGRLDKDSEGLILLTNDGDIVNEILRAEHAHEKEYVVTVDRALTPEFLEAMQRGVAILGTRTRPCTAERIAKNVFRIVLTQGLNRQIRRMCEALGYRVRRLKRIRIMHVVLDGLELGEWRDLTPEEVEELHRRCGRVAASTAAPAEPSRRPPLG
ncbi:pseudouridine synthase [Myxococcota bacterium]|nr:pseudouridine synthase [Myxococcota bacterium]